MNWTALAILTTAIVAVAVCTLTDNDTDDSSVATFEQMDVTPINVPLNV